MKKTTFLLLTTLTIFHKTTSTLKSSQEKWCSDTTLYPTTLSDTELASKRDTYNNMYTSKYVEIVEWLYNSDNKKLFDSFLPYFILYIIIILLIFGSLVIFLITFCCQKKEKGNKKKLCFNFSICLSVFSIILFLVSIALLIFSNLTFNDSMCALYSSAVLLYEGKIDYPDFIGTKNLEVIFGNSVTDFMKLKNMKSDFEEIYKLKPSSSTNKGFSSIINYVNYFANLKIDNGAGVKEISKTSNFLNPSISNTIDSEFNFINQIGFEIEKTSQIGKNPKTYKTIESSTNLIKTSFSLLNQKIEKLLLPLTDDIEEKMELAKISYFVILSFGLILYILIIIQICCIKKTFSNKKKNCCPKFLLVMITFLLLIFAIMVLLLLIGSVGVSSFCGLVQDMNEGKVEVLEEFSDILDSRVIKLFGVCFSDLSDGDMKSVIGLDDVELVKDFDNVLDVLKGLSSYEKFGNFTSNKESIGILEQKKNYDKILYGEETDFDTVDKEIVQLNDLVSCSNHFFALNSTNCETGKICQEILTLNNYSPPECTSSKSEIDLKFQNLKAYTKSEKEFITNLTSDLTTKTESPNLLYKKSIENLFKSNSYIKKINENISETINLLNLYTAPLSEILDCRTVRELTLQFEDSTCFQFSPGIFIMMIFSVLNVFFLIFLIWAFYFGIFCGGKDVDSLKDDSRDESSLDNKDVFSQNDDSIAITDNERIPEY